MPSGDRAIRADRLSGEFPGLGGEVASSSERNPRPSPHDVGPADREIRCESGCPASRPPGAGKAQTSFQSQRRTSAASGSVPCRPGTPGGIPQAGIPGRVVFQRYLQSSFQLKSAAMDGCFLTFAITDDCIHTACAGWAYEIGALAWSGKLTSSQALASAINARSSLLFNSWPDLWP